MTDTGNHADPTLVKYTPVSYQYAALRRDRPISPFGLQYDRRRCAKTYVVNSAVIMAATRLGLIIKPTNHESPNTFFNIGSLVR